MEKNWLNDNIVNFYLNYSMNKKDSVFLFDSAIFRKIDQKNQNGAMEWFKKSIISLIFKYFKLIII